MKRRIPIIDSLLGYFKQEELFKQGQKIQLVTAKMVFKGGASNTIQTVRLSPDVTLVYYRTKNEHCYFRVEGNYLKTDPLQDGDIVYISNVSLNCLHYIKL